MDDANGLGPLQFLALLLEQERRHGDSMEKMAAATDAIAQDLHAMFATTLTAALVYPWANDPHVVRVVLLQSTDEERRLRDSLKRFEGTDRSVPMEEWLKNDGFRLLPAKPVSLDRQGIATFKAKVVHQGLSAPPPLAPPVETPSPPLELEHQSS
jgi:hypothetical protein